MIRNSVRIGITIGDPAGIGPEVALNALSKLDGIDIIPVIIGRYEILAKYYPELIYGYNILDYNRELQFNLHNKYICNIPINLAVPIPGKGNINTGIESREYIDKAIELWKWNKIDAIVTGPVNKGFIEKSGYHFTGHTEYIAESIKEKNSYMLMYSEDYRVLLVTTHIPVLKIPDMIDVEKIYNTIRIGHRAISSIDGDDVSLAICGLDPHCGDDGAIGNFDKEVTKEAVEMSRADGININGPFAADTLFLPWKWKLYNLILAHYHDQGLIPFKTLTFDSGVNVTLGLSVIRTSVAHGTAYDIAGKGMANYSSMIEAIKLAYDLVKKR